MQPTLPYIDYDRHPAYGGMFAPDEAMRREALGILGPILEDQLKVDEAKRGTFGYRYGAEGAQGETLAREGLLRFELPGALIDPICSGAAPLAAKVRGRIDALQAAGEKVHFRDQLEAIDPAAHEALWGALNQSLKALGVYGLATRFFGAARSKLQHARVLISPPKDDAKEGPLPAPPTEGMHIDSSGGCILKGVLYLDEVGAGQGPFGLVPGSHRWEEGSLGRVHRRAVDRSSLIGRGARHRRLFAALPEEMRVKAEFGGDMMRDWPQTRDLVEQEQVSLGPRGLLSLFDPEAIHRGGLAREGERQAILLTIVARWGIAL